MRKAPRWEADYCEYFAGRRASFMRIAYTIVGDWASAEDATQATFVSLYVYWRRVRPESIDAYARRTLVNNCRSAYRKVKYEVVSDGPPELAVEPDPTLAIDLAVALGQLSFRDRAILTLRFLDDQSVAEVSAILDIPTGTVKSQTSRALERLQAVLRPNANQRKV